MNFENLLVIVTVNDSCQTHMQSCRTVTDDQRLFHTLISVDNIQSKLCIISRFLAHLKLIYQKLIQEQFVCIKVLLCWLKHNHYDLQDTKVRIRTPICRDQNCPCKKTLSTSHNLSSVQIQRNFNHSLMTFVYKTFKICEKRQSFMTCWFSHI